MYRWQITIEAWPHSTGKGNVSDQPSAGERVQLYFVQANDIQTALTFAKCIADGMRSNPMVWEAPIMGIIRVQD